MASNEVMELSYEDGRYVVRTPGGERLPKIVYVQIEQDVDLSKKRLANVTIEFIARVKDDEE